MNNWYVYLIENTEGIYYCGITKNVHNRILAHNGYLPGGSKNTRRGRPWTLVDSVSVADMSSALKLEAKVKKARKENKLTILKGELQ